MGGCDEASLKQFAPGEGHLEALGAARRQSEIEEPPKALLEVPCHDDESDDACIERAKNQWSVGHSGWDDVVVGMDHPQGDIAATLEIGIQRVELTTTTVGAVRQRYESEKKKGHHVEVISLAKHDDTRGRKARVFGGAIHVACEVDETDAACQQRGAEAARHRQPKVEKWTSSIEAMRKTVQAKVTVDGETRPLQYETHDQVAQAMQKLQREGHTVTLVESHMQDDPASRQAVVVPSRTGRKSKRTIALASFHWWPRASPADAVRQLQNMAQLYELSLVEYRPGKDGEVDFVVECER